ncbi:MAG: hypothetical protein AB1832_09115 [Pseudomonadota bacterium]
MGVEVVLHLLQAVAVLLQEHHFGARGHVREQAGGILHAGIDEQHVTPGRHAGRTIVLAERTGREGIRAEPGGLVVDQGTLAGEGMRRSHRRRLRGMREFCRGRGDRAIEHHPRLQGHDQRSARRGARTFHDPICGLAAFPPCHWIISLCAGAGPDAINRSCCG